MTRVRLLMLVTLTCTFALPRHLDAQQASAVDVILAKASVYLDGYEKQFAGVVSEEHYTQSMTLDIGRGVQSSKRALVSDVIVLNLAAGSSGGGDAWVVFRDVFEVNANPVRDRDTRLQKLFVDTPGQALVQAQKIMDEGARYNLGTVRRNVNVPTMALSYLRGSNQTRSTFKVSGREKVDNVQTVILTFTETASPTVIRSGAEDLPATGRFWVDPDTGRVVKSELSVKSKTVTAKITVTYASAPALTVWVPASMKEEYATRKGAEHVKGDATYSNFHQFKVSTSVTIK